MTSGRGRRKIEIKKIEKKSSLQVAFSKRRKGLFKKASELSVLCGAKIGILVQSPGNKIFSFGHPSVDALIDHFQEEAAARRPEMAEKMVNESGESPWWEQPMPIENMDIGSLEEYLRALEELKGKVLKRVEEIETLELMNHLTSTSSISDLHPLPFLSDDPQNFKGADSTAVEGLNAAHQAFAGSSSNFLLDPFDCVYEDIWDSIEDPFFFNNL